MAKYGRTASRKVEKAMHEYKRGRLKRGLPAQAGGSGKKVKSRKQAIAIGLSEARRRGGKVPVSPRRRDEAGRHRRGKGAHASSYN